MIAYHTHAGRLGCAERIDIGEHIYRVPLIDDVTGDGIPDVGLGAPGADGGASNGGAIYLVKGQ